MLAVIITIILSPGLDNIPGVLEDGPLPFFLLSVPCPFRGVPEASRAGELHLPNRFGTLSQFVSVSSFELCCPKLEKPC